MSDVQTVLAFLSPSVATSVGVYLAWRLRQVHTIVNSQRDELLEHIDALAEQLRAAGIAPAKPPRNGGD